MIKFFNVYPLQMTFSIKLKAVDPNYIIFKDFYYRLNVRNYFV